MKKYILILIVALTFAFQLSSLVLKPKTTAKSKPVLVKKSPVLPVPTLPQYIPKPTHGVRLKPTQFDALPAWGQVDLRQSLSALRISCRLFLKQNPNRSVGSRYIHLKAKDWHPVCKAASDVSLDSQQDLQTFFQTWFTPVEFHNGKPVEGLFTGYYLPNLEGSLTRSAKYPVPIYATPPNLVTAHLSAFSSHLPQKRIAGRVVDKELLPFYSRAAIDKGALIRNTRVIAWVKHSLDRLTLETEGSGIVQLKEGGQLAVGYAGDNGAKYRSVASILINQKRFTADTASMSRIRRYFKQHPQELRRVIHQNESFVFFRRLPQDKIVGSQGVPLSAGYTLAVDRKWIPMGVPLWLSTKIHDIKTNTAKKFHRLMIAQDTGGSIRGMVRGDIFFGAGTEASDVANKTNSSGHYWLLLPRVKTSANNA